MPNLEITIPHTLPQTEALKRIQTYLPMLKSQHSDRISHLKVIGPATPVHSVSRPQVSKSPGL